MTHRSIGLKQKNPVELKAHFNNARTHSAEQIQQIARSIEEFGFTNPVLVAGANIVAGHGRVEAAKLMGLDKVPCRDISYLDETQQRAYVLADNKLAENAGWDWNLVALEIAELRAVDFDIDMLGFSALELNDIEAASVGEQGDFESLADKSQTCPACGHEWS